MSNETKRDVFEVAMNHAAKSGWVDYGEMMSRYDAALPDNLPVIPQAVGEYIQARKAAHDSLAFVLTARFMPSEVFEWMFMVAGDTDTELSKIEYVKQQDIFSRAWLLGAWRVEETGEIVKLEVEE